jgi:protein-S-isoprenylcysteine O-methyltransferase Ste14
MTAQSVAGTGTAQVIIRPPLLFIGAILLGFVMDHVVAIPIDVPRESEFVHRLVPASLTIIGLLLAVAGIRNLMRSGTPVPTNQPTRALVTTGIHGWTRNPIYLGMFIVYLAIGIAVRSPWILALFIPIVMTIRYGVVAREERYLAEQFGEAYQAYKAQVRRWI